MKKVLIVVSYFVFFVLGGLTFTSLTSTEATSTTKNISVFGGTINYFVDNVRKTPPAGQSGFIYQGTTYVPLRFISESLGEDVTWDGKTRSIYIGDKPQGTVTYMQDLVPHTSTYSHRMSPVRVVTNIGEEFTHSSYDLHTGGYIQTGGHIQSIEYLTNGKFKKFEAYLAPTNRWQNYNKFDNIGYVKIYADDILVYDSGTIASDITEKVKVSADLEGALKVKFELVGFNLGLLDAKFIH